MSRGVPQQAHRPVARSPGKALVPTAERAPKMTDRGRQPTPDGHSTQGEKSAQDGHPYEVEDLATFARHQAWRTRPTVVVEVDSEGDLLLVTCLARPPHIEIDPSAELSVGFQEHEGSFLLTSLCLRGLDLWEHRHRGGAAARSLLPATIADAVDAQRAGGITTVHLEREQAREAIDLWTRFAASRQEHEHHPAVPPTHGDVRTD